MVDKEQFGSFIRRKRVEKDLGLREMAKKIGISPTYLSKCERDEFPPPAEDRVREIAKILDCNVDDLLARAGRVSSDISDIIMRHPIQLTAVSCIGWRIIMSEMSLDTRPARASKSSTLQSRILAISLTLSSAGGGNSSRSHFER